MFEPLLGQKVKDSATGLIGIVVGRVHRMGVGIQYDVQPESDGKTVPNGWLIDPFQLEFVDNGITERIPKEKQQVRYSIGEKGSDKVSGTKGIITVIREDLNGCVSVTLTTKATKKSDNTYTLNIPQDRFQPSFKKPLEVSPVHTGGRTRVSERL